MISIEPGKSSIDEKQEEWEGLARTAANDVVREYISELNDVYIGREDENGRLMSVPFAYNLFKRKLKKNEFYPYKSK